MLAHLVGLLQSLEATPFGQPPSAARIQGPDKIDKVQNRHVCSVSGFKFLAFLPFFAPALLLRRQQDILAGFIMRENRLVRSRMRRRVMKVFRLCPLSCVVCPVGPAHV